MDHDKLGRVISIGDLVKDIISERKFIIEQLDNNRLMRPRARYTGPPNRQVRPIGQRG